MSDRVKECWKLLEGVRPIQGAVVVVSEEQSSQGAVVVASDEQRSQRVCTQQFVLLSNTKRGMDVLL
jgi:hypothetical protein